MALDSDITAEQFLALPSDVRAEYVRVEREYALAQGWTPYWSEKAGCYAWLIPEGE